MLIYAGFAELCPSSTYFWVRNEVTQLLGWQAPSRVDRRHDTYYVVLHVRHWANGYLEIPKRRKVQTIPLYMDHTQCQSLHTHRTILPLSERMLY